MTKIQNNKIGNIPGPVKETFTEKDWKNHENEVKPRKARNWVITCWDTKNYKAWQELDDERIRLLSWQLETTTNGKVHLQAYLETFTPVSLRQVKLILGECHCIPRRGPRYNAYMYTKKEDNIWWDTKFPQWQEHNKRIPGTEHQQLGNFSKRQGCRTDIQQIIDMVDEGATEAQIADSCPREYIKFSTGIRRWRETRARKLRGKHKKINVIVNYGDPGTNKTRWAKDKWGYQNVYEPKWNGQKFWFDTYDGEPIMQINEIDTVEVGIRRLLDLLDNYHKLIEYKGGITVSNWHTVVITTNEDPLTWFNCYEGISQKHQNALARRINEIQEFSSPAPQKTLLDIKRKKVGEVDKSIITLSTSVPTFPIFKTTKFSTEGRIEGAGPPQFYPPGAFGNTRPISNFSGPSLDFPPMGQRS